MHPRLKVGDKVLQLTPSTVGDIFNYPGISTVTKILTSRTVQLNGDETGVMSDRFLRVDEATPEEVEAGTDTNKEVTPTMLSHKDTNPKDAVGTRKWRQFSTIPGLVEAEIGVAMLEGARKYGRHNYRVAGVRGSVYYDAARGHLLQWWEGEDIDPDSGLSHITKAIASLVVLRDSMIQDKLVDDRPPKANLDKVRTELQQVVDGMFEKYPDAAQAYTEKT